ncbi:MAG TPA: nitronate monooxygenase [Candidatus Aminicenantes bacterium]|nr:nitronate monooxygenase [Candidatus Aminicenantes bacterium]
MQLRQRFSLPKIDIPAWKWPARSSETHSFPPFRIGDLEVPVPIVQGGMAVGISLSGLASAVAREGGVGVIAATAIGMTENDYFQNGREANARALTREIRRFREAVTGVLGINIMMAADDFDNLLDVCVREKVDIVFLGAGLPIRGIPVARLRQAGVKIVPIVSSARAARLIFSYWQKTYSDLPDAVVVEGPLAGGHLGFTADDLGKKENRLENLVPTVIRELEAYRENDGLPIPVIAAGGIYTGRDIHRFLRMGAAGVQMGTRFVATDECDAADGFKQAFVSASEKTIRIIESPVGLPGRALDGEFFERLKNNAAGSTRCVWKCLKSCGAEKAHYCISLALNAARKGDLRRGFAFAGANAWRVNHIVPVHNLVRSLAAEYSVALGDLAARLRKEYEKAHDRITELHHDYIRARDTALADLKRKYGPMVTRKSECLRKELAAVQERLAEIKAEYLAHVRKLQATVAQLSPQRFN